MRVITIHNTHRGEEKHRPSNVGAVVMYVLFLQALHDMFHYNWRRFEKIYATWEQDMHTLNYIRGYDPYKRMANQLGMAFNYQLYKDIHCRLPKVIEADDLYAVVLGKRLAYNKQDKCDIQEAAENRLCHDVIYPKT